MLPFGYRGNSNGLLPGWRLDPSALDRGNEILATIAPCDLLIIDEVGPLEMQHGRGWNQAFLALALSRHRAALVVCRPELIDNLNVRLGSKIDCLLEATIESRETLHATVAEHLDLIWSGGASRERQSLSREGGLT